MRPALLFALLCLLACPGAADETVGRLFFTPGERAALDRQRQAASTSPATGSDAALTLDGEILTRAGHRIRWINGKINDHDRPGQPVLPVGDSYHPATGKRESLLGVGRIVISPKGAEK